LIIILEYPLEHSTYFNDNIENYLNILMLNRLINQFKNLKNACKEFDSKITNYDISKLIDVDWLKYYKGDLWNLFEKLVDPTTNGFKISKPGDNLPKEKEVWTDGSSILIKENMWYEFHNTMEEY